jgi:hypothetical protein
MGRDPSWNHPKEKSRSLILMQSVLKQTKEEKLLKNSKNSKKETDY